MADGTTTIFISPLHETPYPCCEQAVNLSSYGRVTKNTNNLNSNEALDQNLEITSQLEEFRDRKPS